MCGTYALAPQVAKTGTACSIIKVDRETHQSIICHVYLSGFIHLHSPSCPYLKWIENGCFKKQTRTLSTCHHNKVKACAIPLGKLGISPIIDPLVCSATHFFCGYQFASVYTRQTQFHLFDNCLFQFLVFKKRVIACFKFKLLFAGLSACHKGKRNEHDARNYLSLSLSFSFTPTPGLYHY